MASNGVTRPPALDVTMQEILDALKAVSFRPQVIDNLTSQDTGAPLSANQGRVLKDAIDNLVTQSITDGDTSHAPSGDAVHDAINAIITTTTIWSGDIHEQFGQGETNEPITNFMAIQCIFNVIPSRSPQYDVVADQSLILTNSNIGAMEISARSADLNAFCIGFSDSTHFSVYTYSKNTSDYNPGLVKIIGLFRKQS